MSARGENREPRRQIESNRVRRRRARGGASCAQRTNVQVGRRPRAPHRPAAERPTRDDGGGAGCRAEPVRRSDAGGGVVGWSPETLGAFSASDRQVKSRYDRRRRCRRKLSRYCARGSGRQRTKCTHTPMDESMLRSRRAVFVVLVCGAAPRSSWRRVRATRGGT